MDRRRFLTGASAGIGAAALGAFVKPAPTPFSEILVLRTEVVAGEVYGMSPAMMAMPDPRMKIYCNKWLHEQLSPDERKAWNTKLIEPIPVT